MKVYVVTSGDYSDYHIDAVFTDPDMAEQYAMLDLDRNIETYEADSVQIDRNEKKYLHVTYDFIHDRIRFADHHCHKAYDDFVYGPDPGLFAMHVANSPRVYRDAKNFYENGRCELLLKIARDRFAVYMEKHGKSREELIRESERKAEKYRKAKEEKRKKNTYASQYVMMKTSGTFAREEVEGILRDTALGGGQLPDPAGLSDMLKQYIDKYSNK